MPSDRYSDEAVRKATGHGLDHWYAILDRFGRDLDHTARAKHLADAAPELSGWWVQGVTVQYERARGLREFGQASSGDFRVSCSKTVELGAGDCFEQVLTRPWLPGAKWREGATFDTEGGRVEVRIVQPGKQLRFWWFDDDGKSTVILALVEGTGKAQIIISHEGLPSADARERYRAKWKAALDDIVH